MRRDAESHFPLEHSATPLYSSPSDTLSNCQLKNALGDTIPGLGVASHHGSSDLDSEASIKGSDEEDECEKPEITGAKNKQLAKLTQGQSPSAPSTQHHHPANLSTRHVQSFGTSTPMTGATRSKKPSRHPESRRQRYAGLPLQPAPRPISQARLTAEIKIIYTDLVIVENKCISVGKEQALVPRKHEIPIEDDQWQALTTLHRTLLHEHHDFLLATQHPSASPALQCLVLKYSMLKRMWKHAIYAYLELLRSRLPESLDHMLAFLCGANNMVALLYETVPAFEIRWMECLGDLGRYRMAIEDTDLDARNVWLETARSWYVKATDKAPAMGRLYHHLAVLAKPNALKQLCYYLRSLVSIEPFIGTRESILTLFDPILERRRLVYQVATEIDLLLIQSHGILFKKQELDRFEPLVNSYLDRLDGHIEKLAVQWKTQGIYIAMANIASLFDYNHDSSVLRPLYDAVFREDVLAAKLLSGSADEEDGSRDTSTYGDVSEALLPYQPSLLFPDAFFHALRLTFSTLQLMLRRFEDKNVLPHIHILLVFLLSLSRVHKQYNCELILDHVPWEDLVNFLNALSSSENITVDSAQFPHQADDDPQPLPEDYMMRGQSWALGYLPDSWFDGAVDLDIRDLELPSTHRNRVERILWLGVLLSVNFKLLCHGGDTGRWSLDEGTSDAHGEKFDSMQITITFDSADSSAKAFHTALSQGTPAHASAYLPIQ